MYEIILAIGEAIDRIIRAKLDIEGHFELDKHKVYIEESFHRELDCHEDICFRNRYSHIRNNTIFGIPITNDINDNALLYVNRSILNRIKTK